MHEQYFTGKAKIVKTNHKRGLTFPGITQGKIPRHERQRQPSLHSSYGQNVEVRNSEISPRKSKKL